MYGILQFFKILGFFPLKFDVQETIKIPETLKIKSLKSLSIIPVIFTCINYYCSFKYHYLIFFVGNIVGYINDVIKYQSVFFTVLLCIFETVYRSKNQERIWTKLKIFEGEEYNLKPALKTEFEKYYKKFSVMFLTLQFLLTFMDFWILYEIQYSPQWISFWWLNTPVMVFCRARHLFLTFYIDLLATNLKVLLKELVNMKENILAINTMSQNDPNYETFSIEIFKRLSQLKFMYGEIWFACTDVNELVGWSETFNFIQIFIQLTCDTYWLYDSATLIEYEGFLPTFLCLIPNISIILPLLNSAENCIYLVSIQEPVCAKTLTS